MPSVVTNIQISLINQMFDQHRAARPALSTHTPFLPAFKLRFLQIIKKVREEVDQSGSVFNIKILVGMIFL